MHKWEALGLFAVPIIKMQIDDVASIADIFHTKIRPAENDLQSNRDVDQTDSLLDHYGNYTDIFSSYPELDFLQKIIEKQATFAYQQLLNYQESGSMRLLSAWFNLAQVGASQAKHAHANALLSGTAYLSADENSSITFYHPLSNGSLHNELYDQAVQSANPHGLRYHYSQVEVAVKAGDCLFWPSYLHHGYTNNRTPNRLSLSFNLMPKHLNSVYQIYP